ncbi:MAG: hypothetical protein EBY28_26855 [Betaproteobacteria bacterium]|nr:hypothetical protein [Betaproteobacteria bacterium]
MLQQHVLLQLTLLEKKKSPRRPWLLLLQRLRLQTLGRMKKQQKQPLLLIMNVLQLYVQMLKQNVLL